MADEGDTFRPALIVVDFQEDFCPPNGSLAVPNGRLIAPVINALLTSPLLAARVATQDWHPPNHVSFASNHPGKSPFVDNITITNPLSTTCPPESYVSQLWPVHCVQNTTGASLVPELTLPSDGSVYILKKGIDSRVEMYSAFYDPLTNPRVSDSGLVGYLKGKGVTHVYVVGLAADYCVRATALDAMKEGFETVIVEEGTRAVDPEGWPAVREGIEEAGVKVVSVDGPEVARLKV